MIVAKSYSLLGKSDVPVSAANQISDFMEEKEPKVGDYLWGISYWSDGREIWKCKIKKVNRKSYTSFAGHLYPKSELGVEFFSSKEEAVQDKIDLHEEKVRNSKMDVEEYEKEIRALKRIKERFLKGG